MRGLTDRDLDFHRADGNRANLITGNLSFVAVEPWTETDRLCAVVPIVPKTPVPSYSGGLLLATRVAVPFGAGAQTAVC